MSNSLSSWADQFTVNRLMGDQLSLPSLKVAQLKEIIKEFNLRTVNGTTPSRLTISGTKADLVARILQRISYFAQEQKYDAFQGHMNIVKGYTSQISSRPSHSRTTGSSKAPYAAVVLPARQEQGNAQARSLGSHHIWWDRTNFKKSPFYEVEERISIPKICSEARDIRSSVTLDVPLTEAHRQALAAPKDSSGRQAQVRFFCTSIDSLNSSLPALMEYPPICELKVNGHIVSNSLRGLKNKPGTVNPPNITRLMQLQHNRNSVELVYANTNKRYAAAVVLVKARSVDSIVEEIKTKRFVTKDDVLQRIRATNADSDIVVGSSVVSIKCPLGFIRINLPCRSRLCQHIQCFDAYTFFHMNEQTPTWTCPVCTNVINSWEELVIDGYFSDILANTPQDQDSIVIEENGNWRPAKENTSTSLSASPPPSSIKRSTSALRDNTPATSQTEEITVIDDEDDNQGTPQTSVRSVDTPVSQRPSKRQRVMEVIDLTLSSDEEEDEEEVEKEPKSTAARDVSAEEAPVKAEGSQDEATASTTFSNGRLATLPAVSSYNVNGDRALFRNGSSSRIGNHAAAENAQTGMERHPLWLPPLRNDSGSPGQYNMPLRNLSPLSNSSQLSSNYEQSSSIPSVNRLNIDGWNGYIVDRESDSERSYSALSNSATRTSMPDSRSISATAPSTSRPPVLPTSDVPVNGSLPSLHAITTVASPGSSAFLALPTLQTSSPGGTPLDPL